MKSAPVLLESKRLRLYPLSLQEMKFATQYGFVEKTPTRNAFYLCVRQKGMVRRAYERMLEQPEAKHLWFTVWLMVLISNKEPVGAIGFEGLQPDGSTQIEYILSAAYVGEGLTSEAVPAMVGWAFAREDCVRITAVAGTYNIGSQKVLEKSGFTLLREEDGQLYYELRCEKQKR